MTRVSQTLSTAILAVLAPASVAATQLRMPLQPEEMECIGQFCRTGTVVMVQPNLNFALEDRDGKRCYLFVQKQLGIRAGDRIVATGDCTRHDNGVLYEIVRRVQRLGHVALPPPQAVPLAELIRKDFLYRNVTTEGTLVLVRQDEVDSKTIQLLVKDGAAVLNAAFTSGTNQTPDMSYLLGARIRMTGFWASSSGARRNSFPFLAINATAGLEVLRPPPANIFAVPELALDSSSTPDEIMRMDTRRFEGIVTGTWGGNQMMLSGRDFHRVKVTLSRPDELPAIGAAVVAAGFPDTDLYSVNLIYARCKVLPGKRDFGPALAPVRATLRQLLTDEHGRPRINGYSHGRLIKISGTVLDVQPSLALFSLNDDGFTMPVDCSSSPDAIPHLEPNSKIEAVILAVTETDSWRESIVLPQTRGLKLILRSPKDIRILSRPPWWTPARLTVLIISLLVAIILIIVANRVINRIMMRRKVAERTRLAVELHDSLSQTLAGVACQIAAGESAVSEDPATARSLLATAERMLESSRTELKNCLFDLRNDTVDDSDFERAILRTLTGLKPEADIAVRFPVARSLMTDTTAHAVLCIIRELVANAIRHGSATHIKVAGTTDEGCLRFSVSDNGCGFDPQRHPGPRDGHFGLAGIHERLAAMNGSFTITSAQGNTRVAVNIALP